MDHDVRPAVRRPRLPRTLRHRLRSPRRRRVRPGAAPGDRRGPRRPAGGRGQAAAHAARRGRRSRIPGGRRTPCRAAYDTGPADDQRLSRTDRAGLDGRMLRRVRLDAAGQAAAFSRLGGTPGDPRRRGAHFGRRLLLHREPHHLGRRGRARDRALYGRGVRRAPRQRPTAQRTARSARPAAERRGVRADAGTCRKPSHAGRAPRDHAALSGTRRPRPRDGRERRGHRRGRAADRTPARRVRTGGAGSAGAARPGPRGRGEAVRGGRRGSGGAGGRTAAAPGRSAVGPYGAGAGARRPQGPGRSRGPLHGVGVRRTRRLAGHRDPPPLPGQLAPAPGRPRLRRLRACPGGPGARRTLGAPGRGLPGGPGEGGTLVAGRAVRDGPRGTRPPGAARVEAR